MFLGLLGDLMITPDKVGLFWDFLGADLKLIISGIFSLYLIT